jgi:hypothetical protein
VRPATSSQDRLSRGVNTRSGSQRIHVSPSRSLGCCRRKAQTGVSVKRQGAGWRRRTCTRRSDSVAPGTTSAGCSGTSTSDMD